MDILNRQSSNEAGRTVVYFLENGNRDGIEKKEREKEKEKEKEKGETICSLFPGTPFRSKLVADPCGSAQTCDWLN
jgi:hypothetical protein